MLAIARVSNAFAFVFLPRGMVYNEKIVVFPVTAFAGFCALQAQVHEVWGRFFNSSLKDDMQYTPSDCFETFPFPQPLCASASLRLGVESDPLESAGNLYYTHRAALMIRNDEGLTKTYNRFHDPDNREPDILRLRNLHAAMDRAVLDAYGWTDVPTNCDFFLDYEIDEETSGNKKKPWRYRWPDDVHDEVLARLLALNQQRYEEETAAGLHDKGRKKTGVARKRSARAANEVTSAPGTLSLFGDRRDR